MASFYRSIVAFVVLLACLPVSVWAADEGLYDPVAPESSAFVRFIHAAPAGEAIIPQANGKHYTTLSFKDVSPYVVVPQGEAGFVLNGFQAKAPLVAGQSYSVVLRPDTVLVLHDGRLDTDAKALISFYNLTTQNGLSLQTAGENAVMIFEDVASGENATRDINPVKLAVDVVKDGAVVASPEPIMLERKNAYSVIAFTNADGAVEVISVRAKTDTTQ